jgi:hypothetical protein
MKDTEFKPNTAYPLHGTWGTIMKQLVERKGKDLPIKLRVTPGLFDHSGTWAAGIRQAIEQGYIAMDSSLLSDGTIYLSTFVEEGYMGDEDGFGVEPDDYLVGAVASDGTFITPLHIS